MIILIMLIGCTPQYSEEEMKETVKSYIDNRYHYVTAENIESRNNNAQDFYSTSFLSSNSPLLSDKEFQKGVQYYIDTNYTSTVISIDISALSDQKNQYVTHLAVLYFTDDHINDSVVNYVFEFEITKENEKYVFDNIKITGNEVLYVPNGEIHVSKGIAHVISETCAHDH